MYFLLKNFNIISEKNTQDFKEILTKIDEFAKKNQYMKLGNDSYSGLTFKTLSGVNYKNVLADMEKSLSSPILEAYKKDGSSYYLRPTKYLCDSYKKSMRISILGITSTSSCSDKEYQSMLQEFAKI
jgi:hypothetical protein